MSAVRTLHWRKPDQYHIRTECGRFTVARVTVKGVDRYCAYRRTETRELVTATELGSAEVSPRATDAERQTAIRAMQRVCEDAASTHFDPPQPHGSRYGQDEEEHRQETHAP